MSDVQTHILPSPSNNLNLFVDFVSISITNTLSLPQLPSNNHGMIIRAIVCATKPKLYTFTMHDIPMLPEPKSYKEALKVPK